MACFRGIVLAFVGSIAAITGAVAQDAAKYPEQMVRVVVPFSAGSMTDLLARVIADKLQQRWNKDVIVENRPGLARHLQRGQGSFRWLHADAHLQRAHRHQPSQQEPGVRSDQGLRRGDSGRHHAPHHGGASRLAGQERQGPDRAGAGEAGRAQLQLRRARQHHGHRRRAVQASHPDRHRARALQRPPGDAYGDHPRRCGDGLFVLRCRGRSHSERKGARAGRHWPQAPERPSRCSDLQGSRGARVRVRFLVRHPGASRYAESDRRKGQRRHCPGRADARRQSTLRAARRVPRQHAARPVRPDHQGRHTTLCRALQGVRTRTAPAAGVERPG